MRTIPPALLTHLQGDTQTICTLWLITRVDGAVFAFTDLDVPVTYSGTTYLAKGGYTHSQIESASDLSTSNLEVDAVFDDSNITQASLESGQWDGASVVVSLVNYADLTMGAVVLDSGLLGQVTINNGSYKAELRGLAQVMQQEQGQVFSPTCRATFGDSRCTLALGPLTFTGSVQTPVSAVQWLDSTLTQTGPTVAYTDSRGSNVPTTGAFQIQVVPPTGGAFVANTQVRDSTGAVMTQVAYGHETAGAYSVQPGGLYTFDVSAAGGEVFIDYTYSIGYFAYGVVKFTSGQNAGFAMEVKTFSPGIVQVVMPLPYAIAAGDTYTITAGCDRQFGTCRDRWNNIVHFRGEPFIPGPDTILRPQGE